jgi:two-component system, NtrC family, response regulator PilR
VRILIVDDDEHVAAGIHRALTLSGYAAESCESAEEALERLCEQAWDLVISDLRLPGMNGQRFLHRVAMLQPAARRILITGFGTPETELWVRQEVDDWLIKPFTTQQLIQAVQRLLPAGAGEEFQP